MTDPEYPVSGVPGNPTPEEISARLEALLKRTHSLREQRAARATSGHPLGMSWPPPDRELDRYDVVDVVDGETSTAQSTDTPAPLQTAAPRQPSLSAHSTDSEPAYPRPDWSELRLRQSADAHQTSTSWLWVATVLLGLLVAAEGAYIWYLQSDTPALRSGRLRVDGPEGADVRVNGQSIGVAPVDHELDPGGYTVDVVQPHSTAHASGVIIGLGRTVVLAIPGLSPAPPAAGASSGSSSSGPTGATTPAARSELAVPPRVATTQPLALPAGSVSPTMGAVSIESTPPGMPVTMGGRPRGVTPVIVGMIKPGRHDVMVGGALRQVDIQANEVTALRVP